MILSGNQLKGNLVSPSYEDDFRLRAKPSLKGVPENDTHDINKLFNGIKEEVRYAGMK